MHAYLKSFRSSLHTSSLTYPTLFATLTYTHTSLFHIDIYTSFTWFLCTFRLISSIYIVFSYGPVFNIAIVEFSCDGVKGCKERQTQTMQWESGRQRLVLKKRWIKETTEFLLLPMSLRLISTACRRSRLPLCSDSVFQHIYNMYLHYYFFFYIRNIYMTNIYSLK